MTRTILIHGGATTSRYWDLVIPRIDGAVLAVDLPGRLDRPADLGTLTVDAAAASVVDDIRAHRWPDPPAGSGEGEQYVLVAHSSGGLEVPAVVGGLGAEHVRAIVLNAASVPPEGGNGFDCMQARHRDRARQALAAADAAGTTITTPVPDAEALRTSSGEELDDDQHAFVRDPLRRVEDSFAIYRTPVFWSQAAGIPVTYIVNGRDRAVPPDLQREMAARLPEPPTIVEIDTGHLPAVTHPELIAEAIATVRG